MMSRSVVALLVLAIAGCGEGVFDSVEIADGTKDATASQTVNGSIRVGSDVTVTSGTFRTVNGAASVGPRSVVPGISVVNGAIRIGEDAQTGTIEAVNGAISIGERVRVNGDLKTVNGVIAVRAGSEVRGLVQAVNGRLALDGTHVHGDVQNHAGGITLTGATLIDGDLVVKESERTGFGISYEELPEIEIGPVVRIKGRLTFERPVRLIIYRGAEVGPIDGATPEWVEP